MTDTLDRRIRRSRRQLADALLELIVEKGYNAVTIQEITDRADLNRATCYKVLIGDRGLGRVMHRVIGYIARGRAGAGAGCALRNRGRRTASGRRP